MPTEAEGAKESLLTKFMNGFKGSITNQYILSNKTTLQNLLVGLVAFGFEELLNDKVFLCPAYHYKTYGNTFQYVPLVCLFFLNLLVIVDQSCLSIFSFPCVKRYRRDSLAYGVTRDILQPFLATFVTSLVGPFVWLISTLIRGRFYVCAKLGYDVYLKPNITQQFVEERMKFTDTMDMTTDEYEALVHEYESEAHIIGWVSLVLLIGGGTLSLLINRCFLNDKERMIGMMEYEKREAIAAFSQFKHWADNKADDEVEEPVMEAKGLPEIAGREMVLFLIKKAKSDVYKDSKYHDKNVFVEVYDDVISLYPRVARGNMTFPYRWSLDHDFEDVEDEVATTTGCCPGKKKRKQERRMRAKYLLEMFYKEKEKQKNLRNVGVGTNGHTEEDTTDGRLEALHDATGPISQPPDPGSEQPNNVMATDTIGEVHSATPNKPHTESGEEIELHELEHTERDNLLI